MNADKAALAEALKQIHVEAGGALSVVAVRRPDMPALLAEALLGGATAIRVIQAATDSLQRITAAPRARPMLCACCPRPIRKNGHFALAIAFPWRADPTRALGMAICERCDDGGRLHEQAAIGLRRIWPDVRTVEVTDQAGGRA